MPDRPPSPPDRQPDDSALRHGAKLVQYIIRTDAYGLMTSRQLEAADYAIGDLLARQARKDEDVSPLYYSTLNAIRHRIRLSLAARAKETADAADALLATQQPAAPPAPPQTPPGGQRMPRPTPDPTQPPPASYARPQPPKTIAPTFGARKPVTINF